jgi:hypothetical protein
MIFSLVCLLLLAACNDSSLEGQQAKWETFVQANRYGTSADIWLVKHNAFGDLEKVGVVFGFLDDYKFCDEVAAMYMQRYPADRYSCMIAN